eukprot:TRINITY_DN63559_c0_g1_i4.p1 TRINITY_DN63559_c0_g1~~TRINITY_DN63559_c0_g1_i4.p1  ORF type:complete len:113 (-),score=23.46 TRINITY_DN63559_c0_g1_i4:10-348(-)
MRPLSEECSLVKERDGWGAPDPTNPATFASEERYRPTLSASSDVDFEIWVECIAKSIALDESRTEVGNTNKEGRDYFVISKGTYTKKLNVVGEIGRAVQQECRDRSRMPSSA